ncbi:MAG: VanZ family protein [Desulfobacteraceae bacterium]|nr:VanZ family protein [Desulfobacteraceae bacterium]
MQKSSNALILNVSYRLPVIALCVLIFWQSCYPGIISEPLFPYDDKVFHFIAYALVSLLCARDLKKEKTSWSPLKIKIISIAFACLYGLSDETHQAFVPQRFASSFDILANCAGSICGSFLYLNFLSQKK